MADSSDTANTSNSVRPFVSSLVFNVALAAGFIVAFSILRPHFKRVYAPRTYAVEKGKRSPVIGSAFFAWIPAILKVPDEKIIQRTGLDTYMFLRSMRSMFIMFTVLGLLSAITILPANITGGNNNEGLSRLSMGNIKPESKKLWVHIVFFMIFVAWVVWNIFKELSVYIKLRMWWLTNQEHTNKVGSSTILVSSLPDNLVDKDDKLEGIFNVFPGGTKQIIVNRNVSELEAVVKDRDAKALKLEGLLTKYAVQCEQAYNKSVKKGGAYKEPKRPTMRESKIPFKGPKVDAITYLSTEIAKLNNQIDEMTEDLSKYKRQSSAFVLFNKQIAAHMSAQTVLDYKPFSMNSVSLDVYPEDIIWSNLNMNPYDRRIRSYISFAGTVGLTVVWTLLTAFLATLVQVKKLRTLGPFKNIPEDSKIMDIFSGIIPSVILAVLMALLPIILRLLLRLEGTPRTSEIELKLLGRFFFFQVWNVYLVTIFSSSILSIMAKSIGNPGEIVKQIEKSVPESATNILVYVLLLAFTGAAKEVLQMVPLFLRYILPKLFAKTPRAIINSLKPKDFDWGTSIPVHTLMFLMGFSYSFIAPIVNWFVAIYFALFYLVYRYQFLYVYNDANWCTGGLSFPKTVKQMFVGIYISEVYMLLMMVAKLKNEANPIIRVVFTALILLFTIGAHIYINDAYMPVINYLPIKRAMEVDQDPTLTTKLPDELVPQDEDLTPEQKIRKKIYAMYGSIIPVKLIDFILKKIPSILVKLTKLSKESDSSGNVADLADEEELRVDSSSIAKKKDGDDDGIGMPVPHHYDSAGLEISHGEKADHQNNGARESASTNILSIDSKSPEVAMPMPDINKVETADEHGLAIYSSTDSATGLRQRQQPIYHHEANHAMYDHHLNAGTTTDNELLKAFTNPAFRAKSITSLWVPMDNNRLAKDVYSEVFRNGQGTIQIICEGTAINEKCTVTADTDFDLDEREADNRDEMQNINLSLRGTRTTLPINDTP